eukprot:GHVQ01042582.1.p1 GENE.GHVQ01042582.1~~GHVQ01042582.1.p1  ORF type:complete len:327 (-),score=72.19 GHVQ01042582.1:547-1527(-)
MALKQQSPSSSSCLIHSIFLLLSPLVLFFFTISFLSITSSAHNSSPPNTDFVGTSNPESLQKAVRYVTRRNSNYTIPRSSIITTNPPSTSTTPASTLARTLMLTDSNTASTTSAVCIYGGESVCDVGVANDHPAELPIGPLPDSSISVPCETTVPDLTSNVSDVAFGDVSTHLQPTGGSRLPSSQLSAPSAENISYTCHADIPDGRQDGAPDEMLAGECELRMEASNDTPYTSAEFMRWCHQQRANYEAGIMATAVSSEQRTDHIAEGMPETDDESSERGSDDTVDKWDTCNCMDDVDMSSGDEVYCENDSSIPPDGMESDDECER